MHLLCFDLDGTLLNNHSEISPFTRDTLAMLSKKDIAYTVATGRTMLSAQRILEGHNFILPHIYNNGVTTWDPKDKALSFENLLNDNEIKTIVDVAIAHGIAPFVNVIDLQVPELTGHEHSHCIFHPETQHAVETQLIEKYFVKTDAKLLPLQALPANSHVTNISMIGDADVISKMWTVLNTHQHLVAYSGPALEGKQYRWMDVHHCLANKGTAVTNLKSKLGATSLICFGDSDNDLSMFELADECYAPANAKADIKKSATGVIGHNHEDGIAHFLRERFSL